jgi:hypothetical protein
MLQNANFKNVDDKAGNPAGGHYNSVGVKINWQNGPLGRGAERIPPNGAFVENVIEAAIMRIKYYQDSKFACFENEQALRHLQMAAAWLDKRTEDRETRQVEGTHVK